ncbi:MAG TPA: S1 RNA-binding domain-containing protein, partial [Planctomycetota bacterium]|nr:S1 RNA-binding domain-containing protein [Planctomycetota bacterium]
MTPRPERESDPLLKEMEDALDGVNLQDLDEQGRMPAKQARKGRGEKHLLRGTVTGTSGADAIVELTPVMQGILPAAEFGDPGPVVGKSYEFGLRGQEEDGLWRLSLSEARSLADWDELEVGARVEAKVSGVNTGGLELRIGPIAAFMPASHVALERIEDLSGELGKKLVCEVLEVDRERQRVLLSRRAVLAAERDAAREESLGNLTVGQVVTGKVTRVEPFGAFVSLMPGVEGLLHVSNLSHQRVENAGDVVQQGQELQVKVLSIAEGGRRIGLGRKQLEADPWQETAARLAPGSVVPAKVTRLMDFGAFCELAPGVEGLLHISQLKSGTDRLRHPREVLSAGQELTVRVVSVEPGAKRIALSRLDERGAVLGSADSVESSEIDRVLREADSGPRGTNLGNLFKK